MPFKKPAGGDRYRSFCGEFRFLSTDDAFNFHVEIWLLNDLVNRNNWKYCTDSTQKTTTTRWFRDTETRTR